MYLTHTIKSVLATASSTTEKALCLFSSSSNVLKALQTAVHGTDGGEGTEKKKKTLYRIASFWK
jgi:hypothetical protein